MGYEITDVPDLPEVVPAKQPGLIEQGFNAVKGMLSTPPPQSPGQSWRDYQ
jgi:hypothetical protein